MKGLYTNSELICSLITDLNGLLKEAVSGQYIKSCVIVSGMAQKLTNLKETIDNDLKNRDETIATLKEELRKAGVEIVEVHDEQLD